MTIRVNIRALFAALGVGAVIVWAVLRHSDPVEWKYNEYSSSTNGGLS
jgi:hypothetical protein